ncbi:hypothetical protein WAX74_03045 [Psychrobacillus sp. FJAT-51614]|uniref:Uncharacterized protein n=1 Tax=Psychrobacillus mangrovi TaxID=3117745 RepID=A0ABU8F103_9BACI
MIDITSGELFINNELIFRPLYRFEEFKNTSYYKNQDGIRVIYLEGKQSIDGNDYYVNFFFREGKIYAVNLIKDDENITELTEPLRKLVHDKILVKYGIENGKEYPWGKVVSDYDARGNVSAITIYYN